MIVDDEPLNCAALYSIIKSMKLENFEKRIDVCLSG